ncbi:spore coat protein U domain-containing protein [Amylibacter sp.]|nr:spore coat protein U domain-containing protein [Amylibacter sp.]
MKMKFKQRSIKISMVSAMLAGAIGLSSASYAGTDTADLLVKSAILGACSITTTEMNFDEYDGTETIATGKVKHNCTLDTATKITMGQGANANTDSNDTTPLRRMKHGDNDYLEYFIYSDIGRSTVWGNTEATSKGATGTGAEAEVLVYGTLPAGQAQPAGNYLDTVLVTITF